MRIDSRWQLVAVCVCLCCGNQTAADDFRVSNAVYVADNDEPISKSETLFHNGVVYDFLNGQEAITCLDTRGKRFVLMNPARRVKTELPTEQLEAFTRQLQLRCASSDQPLLRFMSECEFEEQYDASARTLKLDSELLDYDVQTEASPSDAVSRQYLDFCGWYSRLNCLITPGRLPPFARLRLDAVLYREKALPRKIELTLVDKAGPLRSRTTKMYSVHNFHWQLVESDQQRINLAHEAMATYDEVSFEDFKAVPPAAGQTARR